jgi:hypothetical protein
MVESTTFRTIKSENVQSANFSNLFFSMFDYSANFSKPEQPAYAFTDKFIEPMILDNLGRLKVHRIIRYFQN